MQSLKKNFILLVVLAVLLFVGGILFPKAIVKQPASIVTAIENNQLPETKKEILSPPKLKANSACVFDLIKNEYIFKLNSSAQLPLASLTKLMTAVIAREHLLEMALINIPLEAIEQEGDSGFQDGEVWKLKDLIEIMLVSSSNDAAFAIADSFSFPEFMKLMNKKARELNLVQTYFLDPAGLDLSENEAGAYGSCQDITNLTVYILKKYPDILEITTQETLQINELEFKNTNKLLHRLPSVLGGKTGFDDLAGGNLMMVVDSSMGHPIIITVLNSTKDDRFVDVEKLYNYFILN